MRRFTCVATATKPEPLRRRRKAETARVLAGFLRCVSGGKGHPSKSWWQSLTTPKLPRLSRPISPHLRHIRPLQDTTTRTHAEIWRIARRRNAESRHPRRRPSSTNFKPAATLAGFSTNAPSRRTDCSVLNSPRWINYRTADRMPSQTTPCLPIARTNSIRTRTHRTQPVVIQILMIMSGA